MDYRRSFSSSTLTMKDSRSRPHFSSERRGSTSRSTGMNLRPEYNNNYNRTRRRSSNLSDMYKNPQIYAALKQSSSEISWSLWKKILLLTPSLAIQFCTALTAVFSRTNMELLNIPEGLSSLHLVFAGIISTLLIVAFQKFVCKFYGEKLRNTQLTIGYMLYICVGTLLVLFANIQRISNDKFLSMNYTDVVTPKTIEVTANVFEYGQVFRSKYENAFSNHSSNIEVVEHNLENNMSGLFNQALPSKLSVAPFESSSEVATSPAPYEVISSTSVPLYVTIMAFVGYVIMASSLASGHYLLLTVSMSMTNTDDHDSVITIATAASAIGGGACCLLGAIDLSSAWYPTNDSRYHVYGQIFILSCITIVLLIGCTICSVCTWNFDDIRRKLRRSQESDIQRIVAAMDRRPTRTAQEIFDECAPLLGHGGQPNTLAEEHPSHTERLPREGDQDETVTFTMSQSETVMDDSVFYNRPDVVRPYRLPSTPTTTSPRSRSLVGIIKAQKKFILAVLLVFFLSSCRVSLEYNSSIYLAYTVYEGPLDNGLSYRKGARVASGALFMIYLIFLAIYHFYETIPQQTGWKHLGVGLSAVISLLTLILGFTDRIPVFFAVMCVHGLLSVVVVSLPRLLTAQPARTQIGFQPSTVKQILIETPTTIIWCLTPLSLVLCSAVTSPLGDYLNYHDVPVFYSAAAAILGLVTVICLMLLH